ncbi:MAG: hypothetical protein V3U92_01030 [Cellulophaga sp.]
MEKISSRVCQGLWKEQKRNSDDYQAECKKENADDYHAIEKAKSKRTEETKFYFVLTRKQRIQTLIVIERIKSWGNFILGKRTSYKVLFQI